MREAKPPIRPRRAGTKDPDHHAPRNRNHSRHIQGERVRYSTHGWRRYDAPPQPETYPPGVEATPPLASFHRHPGDGAAAALLWRKRNGDIVSAEDIGDACAAACDEHLSQIETPAPQDQADEDDQLADTAAAEDLVRRLSELWWQAAAPSIEPEKIEHEVSGKIGGVAIHAVIDIVTTDGMVIDIKTARQRPNGMRPDQRLQVTTYAMLDQPANESHTVRLDVLTRTQTPAYVQLKTGLQDSDYLHAERIYPMVAEAMDAGIYLPVRSGNLCTRKYCAHWQTCEVEFGGQVRAA